VRRAISRRISIIIAATLAAILFLVGTLEVGLRSSVSTRPWAPDYPKEDIGAVLFKDSYTDEDYEFLFRQTGLGRIGIDELVAAGDYEKIITIHHQFFDAQSLTYDRFSLFAAVLRRSNTVTRHAILADGDILYSPSTYFSFVEIGHTAIVTNGNEELIAQASGYGTPLIELDTRNFFARPMYAVLRVNVPEEARADAVKYVKDSCLGAEYSIFAGLFGDEGEGELSKTHCSHFIRLAYNQAGIDLDSNGGMLVLPRDIFNSPYVTVVQIFGIDPQKIKAH